MTVRKPGGPRPSRSPLSSRDNATRGQHTGNQRPPQAADVLRQQPARELQLPLRPGDRAPPRTSTSAALRSNLPGSEPGAWPRVTPAWPRVTGARAERPGGGSLGPQSVERRPAKVELNLQISIGIGVDAARAEPNAHGSGQSASGMIWEAGKGKGAKRFYGDMPRGLVGGAVAQRPPGTSCFRFPEWSVARRLWGRWLCRELWNRGLRPTPLWSCLPAASRYSAGDSELWLLPLPVTREYEGRGGGVGWRALTPRGCDGARDR